MSEITIDREVLEQALEWVEAQPEPRMLGAAKIITALREALAQQSSRQVKESLSTVLEQPQLVPVYQYQLANGFWADQTKERYDYNVRNGWATVRVLFTSPQAAPPEPQPVQQEPYGQVTLVRRPGCVDQHWFYRWPDPPHLDNAIECVMVYTSPQVQQMLSDDTFYLLRRLLSNQHTLTGPEFREELTKIVLDEDTKRGAK